MAETPLTYRIMLDYGILASIAVAVHLVLRTLIKSYSSSDMLGNCNASRLRFAKNNCPGIDFMLRSE
jgi:hypothetical protein